MITPEDIGSVESPLTQSGLSGFLQRLFLSFGFDLALLQNLRNQVEEQGRAIATVPVEDEDIRAAIVEVFKNQNA